MYKIVPVSFLAKTFEWLTISVNPFQLFEPTATVYFTLTGENASHSGNMVIPEEVVAEWLTDDVILNYVTAQLNLELAPVEEPAPEETPTEETPTEEPAP